MFLSFLSKPLQSLRSFEMVYTTGLPLVFGSSASKEGNLSIAWEKGQNHGFLLFTGFQFVGCVVLGFGSKAPRRSFGLSLIIALHSRSLSGRAPNTIPVCNSFLWINRVSSLSRSSRTQRKSTENRQNLEKEKSFQEFSYFPHK